MSTPAYVPPFDEAQPVLRKALGSEMEAVPDSRRIRFVISTGDVDRDNDTIDPAGWDLSNYLRNPVVLWAHSHSDLPVGKCVDLGIVSGKLAATCEFATHPFAETVYQLVKGGFMRATSVGFRALEYVRNEVRQGIDFKKQELLEFSIVPVPANQHALIAASAAGVDLGPVKEWVEAVTKAWPTPTVLAALGSAERTVKAGEVSHTTKLVGAQALSDVERLGLALDAVAEKASLLDRRLAALDKGGMAHKDALRVAATDEPLRWNRSLSKAFDIAGQEFPAQSVEQDLAAKYIGVKIGALNHGVERVRSTRMGAFLTALDEFVSADAVHIDAIRNIDYEGREAPPQYEKIKLNSTTARDFLIDGMRFFQWNGEKVCVRVEPRWYGLQVSHYSVRTAAGSAGAAALDAVLARAAQLNFLKGEAFALSGEFLARGGETVADLILDERNQSVVQRVLALVNGKGATMEPRGMLLVGPPGTGKTLTGRILMNGTKSTFIWVSARDMAYGAFEAITEAFDVARACAESILFFEDVDNWIGHGTTIDLLKTELDGIKQNTGILTVLTTNYPERLPKALIDRPGRFHDVLRFDLPAEAARKAMLEKWLPGLPEADVAAAVSATAGMSGAHMRELARFANIIADQDGLGKSEALAAALQKLQEQRDLITAVQAGGSTYRAPSAVLEAAPASAAEMDAAFIKQFNALTGPEALALAKRGRVLSAANEARLRAAMAHLVACAESAGHSHATLGEVLAALPQAPTAAEPMPEEDEDATPEEPDDAEEEGKDFAVWLREPGEVVVELAEGRRAGDVVVELIEAEAVDDATGLEIDAAMLRDVLRSVVAGGVGEMVRQETERALNQMRGRVD